VAVIVLIIAVAVLIVHLQFMISLCVLGTIECSDILVIKIILVLVLVSFQSNHFYRTACNVDAV